MQYEKEILLNLNVAKEIDKADESVQLAAACLRLAHQVECFEESFAVRSGF